MSLPIESLVGDLYQVGLFVAALIGFGFGFTLERAGFGRAPTLTGQFYLYDMTVFKVMFGAIVTAMLGVLVASGIGLVDLKVLSEGAVSATFVWPMLVGGLMLGAGFVISGYCPGTSLVSTASGNIDGLVALSGVFVGSILYGEVYPLIATFHTSGAKGQVFLYQLLGVHPVVVGIAVTVVAIGGFIGAEKVEKIMTRKIAAASLVIDEEVRSARAPRRLAFAVYGAVTLAMVGTFFFPVATEAEPAVREARAISASELARRILDEPWTLRIVDVRNTEACSKERIPGAECVALAELDKLGLAYSPGSRTLVLVSDTGLRAPPPAALTYPGEIRLLEDGHAGWVAFALTEPTPPSPGATAAEQRAFNFRAAVHSAMTGAAAPPPAPAAPVQAYVPKKKKKGGGCN